MATFVLIPGMWHGGWTFDPITAGLREHGHLAYPLTLTGVSERSHLLSGGVNLDTHIRDVTAVLESENIEDAVLVGHSYGGMVITGAADRSPARVSRLVYVDAVVPRNGDSQWSLVTDREREWYQDVVESGYAARPLPFFDPRATAHPLSSLFQPLQLTGDLAHIRGWDYVYAASWIGPSPFTQLYRRLSLDPTWTTHSLDSGHNVMGDAPDELLTILLHAGSERDRRSETGDPER
jgi:pimeloyl-ACP methyl ester carboxylesterase